MLLKYEFSEDKKEMFLGTPEKKKSSYNTLDISKFSVTTIMESLVGKGSEDLYTKRELVELYGDLKSLKDSTQFKNIVQEIKNNDLSELNKAKLSYELSDDKTVINLNAGFGVSVPFETIELSNLNTVKVIEELTFDDNDKVKQHEFTKSEKNLLIDELEEFIESDEFKDILNQVKIHKLENKMSELIKEALDNGLDVFSIKESFTKKLVSEQDKMIEQQTSFFKNEKGFTMDDPW